MPPSIIQSATLLVYLLLAVGKADADPFVHASQGNGALIEKLVVVRQNPRVRPLKDASIGSAPQILPLSIFWRLKTNTPDNQQDSYLLAGNQSGNPLIWIHSDDVQRWSTRCIIDPLPNANGPIFTLYADPHLTKPIQQVPGHSPPTNTPHLPVAIVTGPGHTPIAETQGVLVLYQDENDAPIHATQIECRTSSISQHLHTFLTRNEMRHLLYRLGLAIKSLNTYRDNPTLSAADRYRDNLQSLYHCYLFGTAGPSTYERAKNIREHIVLLGAEGLLFDINLKTLDRNGLLDISYRLREARAKIMRLYDSPYRWFAPNDFTETRCCYISANMLP